MRTLFLTALATAFLWLSTGAQPATASSLAPLSSPDDVAELIRTGDPLVLDIRGDKVEDGRIPGAVSAPYNGEQAHPAAARPGTIPQSEYFTHSGWFSGGPAIVDAAAARKLAADNGFREDDALVAFCNTGHWASTNWFALSELAGIENVKLYPESLVGWSNAGLPMANTPGLIQTFINRIKQAL